MEALRDIKGIVAISDFSWVLLLFLIIVVLLLIGWAVWKRKRHLPTPREKAIAHLQSINIEDAKACAYALTQFKDTLIHAQNQALFEALHATLQGYKYKAYDAPLTPEEKALWHQFLGSCDVHI